MDGMFDPEAPIWAFMSKIGDLMILAALWWLCSLGIITFGASTSALFYVIGKKVRGEETRVTSDFFKSFQQNLKPSLGIAIIQVGLIISFSMYFIYIYNIGMDGRQEVIANSNVKYVIPLTMLFGAYLINFIAYFWALLSRFDLPTPLLLKNTLLMMHRHLLTSLVNIVVVVVFALVTYYSFPPLIIFGPVIVVYGQSIMLQKRFTSYIEESKRQAEAKNVTTE